MSLYLVLSEVVAEPITRIDTELNELYKQFLRHLFIKFTMTAQETNIIGYGDLTNIPFEPDISELYYIKFTLYYNEYGLDK